MLKAIILDLDNTVYKYDVCHEFAIDKTYEYLKNITEISKSDFFSMLDEVKKQVKIDLKDTASSHNRLFYFQKLLENLNINPLNKADTMYEIYWNNFFEKMVLRNGCIDLFKYLKQNDIKIAICTDLTAYLQYKKIEKLRIDRYIDCIVTSEEVGVEKPNIKMFDTITKKLDILNSECIYIGDDPIKDIEGANNCNIEALLIEDDFFKIKKYIEGRISNEKY